MTKEQRVRAALTGETPDQLPYSFWTHLPEIDLDPIRLANETYNFFKEYDIDFIKTMNNGMYSIEDFGCEVDYSDISKGGVAKITKTPIEKVSDWGNIKEASILEGALKRELYSLELLLDMVNGEAPVVFTVFSPITTIEKISGKMLIEHIKNGGGEYIHHALREITKTTCKLAEKAIEMGAAGIFLASQMSCFDAMTDVEYLEYGKPYDIMVLNAANGGWFNAIHTHGENIMFDILKDYPVDAFNWHAWETLPNIDEARDLSGKCIMGGLKRMDITYRNKNAINNQIYNCVKTLKCKKHILTPGCVIRYPLDNDMLKFVKSAKDSIENRMRENKLITERFVL